MLRRLLIVTAAVLTIGAVALAQDFAPTTGDGPDVIAKNTTGYSATVSQTVQLILPQAIALHLDVGTLAFDLTSLDGAGWPNSTTDFGNQMVCVYGFSPTDTTSQKGPDYYSQTQVLPLGVGYGVGEGGWPNLHADGNGLVTAYPPIKLDANGELVPGSKDYFVCFRSFYLQKFSNGPTFDLTALRTDDSTAAGAIRRLYIQDNPCDSFPADTGLYDLPSNELRHLVRISLGQGTTGDLAAANHDLCGYSSWLNDLMVMAVVVDGEAAGTNTANVQFTMLVPDWRPPE